MKHSFLYSIDASILCLILFAGCILMVIVGKKVRDKFLSIDEQESKGGVNSLLAALFGLWGFMLAFTFNSVSARFENIRAMMVDEANLIRVVLLRTETLPDSLQNGFREDLRKYLQARIEYYDAPEGSEEFNKTKQDAVEIGKRLWAQTVKITQVPGFSISVSNMLAALTGMFDVGSRRDAMLMSGMPTPISVMLFLIALVISLVGGFTSPVLRMKEWVVIVGFILLACLIIYVTLDMARPMSGFIRPDIGQEKIVQLKELF